MKSGNSIQPSIEHAILGQSRVEVPCGSRFLGEGGELRNLSHHIRVRKMQDMLETSVMRLGDNRMLMMSMDLRQLISCVIP